jgi:hypothetical protein
MLKAIWWIGKKATRLSLLNHNIDNKQPSASMIQLGRPKSEDPMLPLDVFMGAHLRRKETDTKQSLMEKVLALWRIIRLRPSNFMIRTMRDFT